MADAADTYLESVKEAIEEYGWLVQAVFPTADDEGYGFTYTVGLTQYDHPELIIMSISPQNAQSILNSAGLRIKGGEKFTHGQTDSELIVGYDATFIEVPDIREAEMFVADTYYKGKATGLQIVWPDKEGRFPWDEGYAMSPEIQPVFGTKERT